MSNVLELNGVTKDYGDFLLDHVTFSVPEGCICGFVGQNGAGKTTTIKCILDIINKNDGEIRVFGKDPAKEGKILKEDIGVVFDEMGLHDFLTAKQINTIMRNVYANWEEKTFYDYLKRFALPTKKRCGDFSRGMRMKLQIAIAMSHKAKLLLMDEPTSGLDPIVRNEILQIFQEYVMDEEHTILLSSHITGDIERIADMVTFIDHGKIVLAGNKDEILERHAIIRCKKDDLDKINPEDVVYAGKSSFGVEALVSDRESFAKKYPKFIMEKAMLEEIMIFYVNAAKGEPAVREEDHADSAGQ